MAGTLQKTIMKPQSKLNDIIQIYNQLSIFVGKHAYITEFWKSEPFMKNVFPQLKDWQKHWKNRVEHYLPRSRLVQIPCLTTNMIERWDPKKKKEANQYTLIKVSSLFGHDIVQLYKGANQAE